MKKISQKILIITNIILFVVSFGLLEYSKMFRMSEKLHWIYSFGHNWWFIVALPFAFWGSLTLAFYSYFKKTEKKFLYIFFSIIPIILFLILFVF